MANMEVTLQIIVNVVLSLNQIVFPLFESHCWYYK